MTGGAKLFSRHEVIREDEFADRRPTSGAESIQTSPFQWPEVGPVPKGQENGGKNRKKGRRKEKRITTVVVCTVQVRQGR